MKNKLVGIALLALLVGGMGGFYAGTAYAKSKNTSNNSSVGGAFGMRGNRTGVGGQFRGQGGTGMNGGNFITGDILSKDEKSITVKLRDGGSKIIFFNTSTPVRETIMGSIEDLKEGTSVMVGGTTNSDGSVTAQTIQVRTDEQLRNPATPASTTKK